VRIDNPATFLVLAAFAGASAAAPPDYPTRPIRLVMPYPVGGSIDISGRIVAQQLGENLGQQVVIDNRTGAGGTIGTEVGASAPPDGYTIVMGGTGTLAVSPALERRLGYDPVKDFAPVTLLVTIPYVLVAHPALPANSVKELIALARAQPGKLNYASGGSGSAPHLIGEMFKAAAGLNIVHVPYKGSTPAVNDLMGGQVQMLFTGIPSVSSHLRSGRLKAIGITSAKRTPSLPEVATVAESGVPGFDVSPWFGILAPARTPPALVGRLNAELVKVLQTPSIRDRLTRDGVDAVGNSPREFAAFIAAEITKWSKVVKASGAKVE
jgi:tripartite-type tricarboxylate transporter receptor subunit TctC